MATNSDWGAENIAVQTKVRTVLRNFIWHLLCEWSHPNPPVHTPADDQFLFLQKFVCSMPVWQALIQEPASASVGRFCKPSALTSSVGFTNITATIVM